MVGPEQIFAVCLTILVIGGGVGLFWWRGRAVGYAPYFAGWFLTWPVIGYMGAQGFTGLVVFLALPVLIFVRPKSIPAYAMVFFAFLGWVVAASFWSPSGKPLLEGSLSAGTFTMDMVGARVALTGLACTAMLLAVRHIPEMITGKSVLVIRVTALVQGVSVLVTALAMQPIITLIVNSGQSDVSNMTQNLLRNATSFLLLLPWLLAWLWQLSGRLKGKILAVIILILAMAAFTLTGTQTAMVGTMFILAAMGLVHWLPNQGFRVLFSAIAAYVSLAPVILSYGLSQLRLLGVPLPASFFSRSYSWELVGQKIGEKPFFGHGLEASHNWNDTYADHPEWLADSVVRYGDKVDFTNYSVVPTHPHNMALQIWAETGMVGAFLVALAILLLGWRLRAPSDWSPISRYAAAGLTGAALAMFSFAYSMWNEAFWASVAVAAAVILLQARQDGEV